MIQENVYDSAVAYPGLAYKTKQFVALTKPRLTSVVVFSGAIGYFMALQSSFEWGPFLAFLLGSYFITGAANTMNQVIEKDLDKLMRRTLSRPLPTGNLNVSESIIFALAMTLAGAILIGTFVNMLAAGLCLLSLVLYSFIYTPLKQISPISVLVGAFPGAFPPLIGYAAVANGIPGEAIILFSIQFIWQFPHFWSIAWVGHEDYQKAGFKMLPTKAGKSFNTSFQIMLYTLFLVPMGLIPWYFGMSGWVSAVVAVACGAFFLWKTIVLMRTGTDKAALKIMFASFIYLPVVQLAFLIDKI
ncbi:heme o synthase [Rapidithrix thailandica]|uniref:Protoheme IX farnesyltransferase n=1 Tax=Rapidithrix thailandica TaxID=413964 RepID=A0AAW9SEI0_9BACT